MNFFLFSSLLLGVLLAVVKIDEHLSLSDESFSPSTAESLLLLGNSSIQSHLFFGATKGGETLWKPSLHMVSK
jgi:hypothetical protein